MKVKKKWTNKPFIHEPIITSYGTNYKLNKQQQINDKTVVVMQNIVTLLLFWTCMRFSNTQMHTIHSTYVLKFLLQHNSCAIFKNGYSIKIVNKWSFAIIWMHNEAQLSRWPICRAFCKAAKACSGILPCTTVLRKLW